MILKIRTMSQRHRCRVEKGDDSMEAIEKMVQEALDSTKSCLLYTSWVSGMHLIT